MLNLGCTVGQNAGKNLILSKKEINTLAELMRRQRDWFYPRIGEGVIVLPKDITKTTKDDFVYQFKFYRFFQHNRIRTKYSSFKISLYIILSDL